jgi:hypothetical protein
MGDPLTWRYEVCNKHARRKQQKNVVCKLVFRCK